MSLRKALTTGLVSIAVCTGLLASPAAAAVAPGPRLSAASSSDPQGAVLPLNVSPLARDSVARLYRAYFQRDPDVRGLSFWVARYASGSATLAAVSDSFAASPEFVARYGALAAAGFVDLVYRNVMGRLPDSAGAAYWVSVLERRAATRGGLMVNFSESAEFVALTFTVAPQPALPGPYTFMHVSPNGMPARYNPCAPILFQTNFSAGPPFAREAVTHALLRIEAATGLDFQHVGETTLITPALAAGPTAPVLIAFASEAEMPYLAGAAGLGGSFVTPQRSGALVNTTGSVTITTNFDWVKAPRGRDALALIFMHELGHLVGLDHVDDATQVMSTFATIRPGGPEFATGDLRGLYELGAARGCL